MYSSKIALRIILAALSCQFFFAGLASARFDVTDADQIDQEERLNSESYNDATTYRFPIHWQTLWQEKDLGYRVSAGSMNVNKFLIWEDLKLSTDPDKPVVFSLTQQRREDLLEQRSEQELRIQWQLMPPFYFAVLGDGAHFKKWGDIGFAAGLRQDRNHFFEIYYYSVDHYYNEKEDTGDIYSRKTWTSGARTVWGFTNNLQLTAKYEYDAPLLWKRPSKSYTYEYMRQQLDYELNYQVAPSLNLLGAGRVERKTESKDWHELDLKKTLTRQVYENEVGAKYLTGPESYIHGGLRRIDRAAHYHHDGLGKDPETKEERFSPKSRRAEFLTYGLLYHPFGDSTKHFMQYGPIESYVEIRENEKSFYTNEFKLQWSYEYRIAKTAFVVLNTNWDLDNMSVDFPYQETPFRPWDGGDIQFFAVF